MTLDPRGKLAAVKRKSRRQKLKIIVSPDISARKQLVKHTLGGRKIVIANVSDLNVRADNRIVQACKISLPRLKLTVDENGKPARAGIGNAKHISPDRGKILNALTEGEIEKLKISAEKLKSVISQIQY